MDEVVYPGRAGPSSAVLSRANAMRAGPLGVPFACAIFTVLPDPTRGGRVPVPASAHA